MTRFVTVAAYLYPTDAYLARARLEAAGIPCVLANEHMTRMNWAITNALHGIQAQVPEADAARALAILRDDADHSLESWVAFEQEEAAGTEGSSEDSSAAGPDESGGMGRQTTPADGTSRTDGYLAEFLAETPEGVCPRCGSANVKPRNLARVLRVLLVFALFFSPLPDRRRRFCCRDCGHRW